MGTHPIKYTPLIWYILLGVESCLFVSKFVKTKGVCPLCSLQDSILMQVQRIVKGEVSLAMKEQQAAVTSSIMQAMRSAAGTPVPSAHLDYQAQQASVLQLLQQGQLNEAFQQVGYWSLDTHTS